MMIFKKALPRRTFLRGMGVSVALPMLSAMIPALARASDPASKMPLRVGYSYVPNGIIRERWRPATAGSDYEMTDILKEWSAYRDQLLVISNMDNGELESVSGHSGGSSMYLTGSKPNKSLSEIRCGISVDQVFAREFGKVTPLSSLQICIENAAELAGQSNAGYSSAYTNTISWGSPTMPLPMEHRPREIFERLFGAGGTRQDVRQAQIRKEKSILDFVRNEVMDVRKELGADDSQKLEEYLDAVRDVEFRVQKAEKKTDMQLPDMQRPIGIPPLEDHLRLMYDLMVLAFQTDMTRVFTFMVAREYSELVYTHLGHQDPHHPLTHHRGDENRKRQAGEIDIYHAKMFGEFIGKLKNAKDADGSSLLDNSIIVFGSGMGNGDIHSQWNVPVALFGSAGGKLKGGRHIMVKAGTPLCNMHVAMLNTLGVPTEHFGRASGELDLSATA